MFSLMVSGTPSSGECAAPARQRAADARACSSAPSRSMRYMALIFGSHASMRASKARVTSSGEISPPAYADDSASAERSVMENPLYTARGDDKKAVDRVHRRVHLAHGARGDRNQAVACGERLAGRRARAADRALQRLTARIPRAAGV